MREEGIASGYVWFLLFDDYLVGECVFQVIGNDQLNSKLTREGRALPA
jgi:hypothetical protein